MNTSTAFSSISGWTDIFSYQWYYIDNMTDIRTDVGSPSSFSAGSENLSWTVNPGASGLGTFSYYVDITNIYTPTPTSTSGIVTNFIYVAKVEVAAVTYSVGDPGPGGGTVFYKNSSGFYSNGVLCHYLEIGPTSLGSPEWGADGTFLGVTASAIGSGYTNTQTLVTRLTSRGESGTAAQLVKDYTTGANDWFLPSVDELDALYQSGLTSLISTLGSMWSSTESSATNAWFVYEYGSGDDPKWAMLNCYPIRAFP
jgi:hypothetical protein